MSIKNGGGLCRMKLDLKCLRQSLSQMCSAFWRARTAHCCGENTTKWIWFSPQLFFCEQTFSVTRRSFHVNMKQHLCIANMKNKLHERAETKWYWWNGYLNLWQAKALREGTAALFKPENRPSVMPEQTTPPPGSTLPPQPPVPGSTPRNIPVSPRVMTKASETNPPRRSPSKSTSSRSLKQSGFSPSEASRRLLCNCNWLLVFSCVF